MISSLLPVALALIPFIVILFVVYLVFGKKVSNRLAIIFVIIFLAFVASVLFFVSPFSKKNATVAAGEKIAAQVIKQDYPATKYSVTGRLATIGDEIYNEYHIQLATDFNEATFQKLNKDVCERLGDKTAHLITSSTTSDLNPLRGATSTCGP